MALAYVFVPLGFTPRLLQTMIAGFTAAARLRRLFCAWSSPGDGGHLDTFGGQLRGLLVELFGATQRRPAFEGLSLTLEGHRT